MSRYLSKKPRQFLGPSESDGRNICAITKTMYPPGYHHNGFVSTNAQEHSVYNEFIITFDASMFLQRVNYDAKSRMKDMKLRHYKNV